MLVEPRIASNAAGWSIQVSNDESAAGGGPIWSIRRLQLGLAPNATAATCLGALAQRPAPGCRAEKPKRTRFSYCQGVCQAHRSYLGTFARPLPRPITGPVQVLPGDGDAPVQAQSALGPSADIRIY